jgi:uncharacterized hydrophobic protein (TIGR00271 family)
VSLTDDVVALATEDPAVSALSVVRGASVIPAGDVIEVDVAREGADALVTRLFAMGLHEQGTVHITTVPTWISRPGFNAEQQTPGRGADAVVWPEVVQRSYEESELTWTFLSFMVLATVLASIAIVLDSQILVIGAMILGPEFGAIAALGVALVQRRRALLRFAARTLIAGFAVAIAATAVVVAVWRFLGWVTIEDVTGPRPLTAFIYTPDRWSIVVAVVAAAAGVLSMTSAKERGVAGVFVSVTTIPAAGNVALALVFGAWHEVWGSSLQLAINLVAMAIAGWLTLVAQAFVWRRSAQRRTRFPLDPRRGPPSN